MLTPEQIARLVVSEPDWCNCTLASGEIDFDRLRAHIAAALRAERERCAQIALSNLKGRIEEGTGLGIAARILGDMEAARALWVELARIRA